MRRLLNSTFFMIYFLSMSAEGMEIEDLIKGRLKCDRLKNGLLLCSYEMSSPKVALQLWLGTGSAEEDKSLAGIAHLFEHMMFKGTKKRGLGQISREIEEIGGNLNAHTSYDSTAYEINVPAEMVEKAMDVLSDMVLNPVFSDDELLKEIEVVVEEYRRGEDSPEGKLWKESLKFFFGEHPYGFPIIGTPETVRRVKKEHLYSFMEKWYVPENAMLIAAGGVKFEKIFSLADKYFSGWRSAKSSLKTPGSFTPPPGPRVLIFTKKNLEEPKFVILFPGVKRADPRAPLHDLLAKSLGGMPPSRLYKNLVLKRNLLPSIYAGSWSLARDGAFFVSGTLRKGNFMESLGEIFKEISSFAFTGPAEEEFLTAKESTLKSLKNLFEVSSSVAEIFGGTFVETGNPEDFFTYLKNYQNLKRENLYEEGKRLFELSKVTFVLMIPEDMKVEEERMRKIIQENMTLHPVSSYAKMNVDQRGIKTFTLPNGLRCILMPRKDTPTISVSLAFSGGLIAEDAQKNGVSYLTSLSLRRGTKYHSAQELAFLIEKYFTQFYSRSDYEYFSINATFLKEDVIDAIELFSEIVLFPSFDKDEVEKAKLDQISLIKSQREIPSARLFDKLRETLFPDHPYGRDIEGREEIVSSLSAEDVRNYYERIRNGKNGVLAVAGDFEENGLIKLFELLSEMPEGKEKIIAFPPSKVEKTKIVFEPMETEQSHIGLAFYAPGLLHEFRYPLDVIDAALSGMSGRLFINLRDKKALAYAVTALYFARTRTGSFIFYIATAPEKVKEAVEGFRKEIDALLEESLSKEEVERGKKYVTGNYQMDFETNDTYAVRLALSELLLGNYAKVFEYPEIIKKVSPDRVRKALRGTIDPSSYFLVIVGPQRTKEYMREGD